jgi:hypothetical protein
MSPLSKNWIAFFFGLGAITQIRIVGAMGITEAFCVVLSPFVLVKVWPKMRETLGQKILVFLFLWFLSAGTTDLYRETSLYDALRGVFVLPFLFAAFVVSFALLWDDFTRVRWIALGIAISGVLSISFFPAQSIVAKASEMGMDVEAAMDFTNYYANITSLVIGAFAAFLYPKIPRMTVFILIIASVGFLIGGSRNGFLTFTFSAGGIWLAQRRILSLQIVQRNTIMVAAFVIIGGLIAMEFYTYSAEQGWLGEAAYDKYKRQSESEIGLLSGRAEFIAAILAIKDSPFLGHGSWSVDRNNYGVRMLEYVGRYNEARVRGNRIREQDMWLPAHSHLWQAWIWHGFFGGLFWIFVLVLILRFFKQAIHLCRPIIAYSFLLLTDSVWDLLFSPFSYRIRWGVLFATVVLGLAEVERRRRKKEIDSTFNVDAPWNGSWTG